ncbi:MAG: hypothetical protein ACE5JX_10025 [Acidobacteriota bacterium]
MNWTRAIIAGAVGGIVLNLADFVMHGMIMSKTYAKYPIFIQEEGNPLWFFLLAICTGILAALLFAKTRGSWSAGARGGATFGFWLGLVSFFPQFYNPLIFKGFPYFLSWCWGGIIVIGLVIFGTVVGAIYKES